MPINKLFLIKFNFFLVTMLEGKYIFILFALVQIYHCER